MRAADPTVRRRGVLEQTDLVALIVGVSLLLQAMDSTMVAAAIPRIARDFGVPVADMHIVVTGYLIGSAACLPLSGWLAQRFGAKRILIVAIVAFGLVSIACGFCRSLPELAAGRVLQGGVSSLLLPVGRLVLVKSAPKEKLLDAIGTYTIPMFFGPLIGPVLGGLIIDTLDWRWIYFCYAPLSFLGAVLIAASVREIDAEDPPALDVVGFLLSGATLAAFGAALTSLARTDLRLGFALVAAAIVGAMAYRAHAKGTHQPALDLTLFAVNDFRRAMLAGFFVRMPLTAGPFLLSLLFQSGFQFSATLTGGLIMATAAGALLVRAVTKPLCSVLGFWRLTWLTALIAGATIAAASLFTKATPLALMASILFAHGLTRSVSLTNLTALAFGEAPDFQAAAATTLFGVVQLIAHAIAVASAAMLVDFAQWSFHDNVLAGRDVAPALIALGVVSALGAPIAFGAPPIIDMRYGARRVTPSAGAGTSP